MPRNLTFDEIVAKADNITEIASKIRQLIRVAKEARSDGEISDEEVAEIAEAANEIVDAAQELASEFVEDLTD